MAAATGPSTGTNAEFAFAADFSIAIRFSLLEELLMNFEARAQLSNHAAARPKQFRVRLSRTGSFVEDRSFGPTESRWRSVPSQSHSPASPRARPSQTPAGSARISHC